MILLLLKWLSKIITTGNYTDYDAFVNRKMEILFFIREKYDIFERE